MIRHWLTKMEMFENEELKQEVRTMIAMIEAGGGIDLEGAERWVVEGMSNPASFFRNLPALLPDGGVLYVEGCGISEEAARLYETHRESEPVSMARDTVFPAPRIFHIVLSPEVLETLADRLSRQSKKEWFDHVKAYRDGKLLLYFHDAFDGSDFLVSERVSKDRVVEFCASTGLVFRSEPAVNRRSAEQLRGFLQALENGQPVPEHKPWWRKILMFWRR